MVSCFFPLAAVLYALLLHALARTGVTGASLLSTEGGAPGYALAFRSAGAIFRLVAIFALASGAFAIAPELESGRHRMPLLHAARGAWLAGKGAFLGVLGAAVLALVMASALATGAATCHLQGIEAGGLVIHSNTALFGSALAATLLAILPLATFVLLGVAVSTLARSGELALLFALVAVTILWGLSLLPGVGGTIFLSRAGWPLEVARSKSEGLRTEAFLPGLVPFVLVHAAWMAALAALAIIAFKKRDLP